MKRFWRLFSLVALLVTTLGMMGCNLLNVPGDLYINNDVDEPILQLYVAPSSDADWGHEWLNGSTIGGLAAYTVSGLLPDTYKVKIVDAYGSWVLFDVEIRSMDTTKVNTSGMLAE